MAASATLAKKKGISGSAPQFHATVTYKIWVWKQIKQRGWKLLDLADAMKRIGTSTTDGGLSQLLGPEDPEAPRVPSNTSLMPAINKVFGLPEPPIFDPTDKIALLRDRFVERYKRLSSRDRAIIDALLAEESASKTD